jgi:hypothetical protein
MAAFNWTAKILFSSASFFASLCNSLFSLWSFSSACYKRAYSDSKKSPLEHLSDRENRLSTNWISMLVMKMILHSSKPIGAMLGGFMPMTIKLRQKLPLNRTLGIEFAPHHKQELVHPLDMSKDSRLAQLLLDHCICLRYEMMAPSLSV